MIETGYKCPECGHTKFFEAYDVVLRCDLQVSNRGWYWSGRSFDKVELDENTKLECGACGHSAPVREFEEDRL